MSEKYVAISGYMNLFMKTQGQKEAILQHEFDKNFARCLTEKRDLEERFH